MAYRRVPFYNIDAAVGPGKPNRPDDVVLVKFLLSEVSKVESGWRNQPAQKLDLSPTPTPLLFEWIKSYQTLKASYQGTPIRADGIIDPARDALGSLSTVSKTFYTIAWLNSDLETHNATFYYRLHIDGPAELRMAIRQRK